MSVDTTLNTLFNGIKKNPDRKSFKGYFALLRYLMDPIFITQAPVELQLSKELHNRLLTYCNETSNVTFAVITKYCGIPIVINESFPDDRLELHYKDRILMESIEL